MNQIKEIQKSISDQNTHIQQNIQDQMIKNNKYEKEIEDLKHLTQEQSDQIKLLINMQKDFKKSNDQTIKHLKTNISSINKN